MSGSAMVLGLRRMQVLSEIGVDNNTTTVLMMPSGIMSKAKDLGALPATAA